MTSYPTTRHGKTHVRLEASQTEGDTLCGRLASGGASLSLATAFVATCKTCKDLYEVAASIAGETSSDPLVASIFRQ